MQERHAVVGGRDEGIVHPGPDGGGHSPGQVCAEHPAPSADAGQPPDPESVRSGPTLGVHWGTHAGSPSESGGQFRAMLSDAEIAQWFG
jgi:hypothetical protein